ncbi:cytochrome b/b6 domain-containing protein [Massilia sp. BKSP1R2A-1]|uniref:cytochrome b/b6 domain-containing protein n=1 Tax=Massilia sp. BKSP1R2A-1 TaxID=3422595 RepID=UPI003D342B37
MTARQLFHPQQTETATPRRRILVWDAPVRVFHWLMVLAFAGAWLTAEQDGWRPLHITLGYTMAGLVGFRLAWGLVGTRYARFSEFVHGVGSVRRYFRALWRGQPEHYTGHNPAGAIAIVLMLLLTVAIAASGWATERGIGGDAMEEAHEILAALMLGLVGFHVAAVLASSWLHRENLIGAMIVGCKAGKPEDAIPTTRRGVAALLLFVVLGFWWLQWQQAPAGPTSGEVDQLSLVVDEGMLGTAGNVQCPDHNAGLIDIADAAVRGRKLLELALAVQEGAVIPAAGDVAAVVDEGGRTDVPAGREFLHPPTAPTGRRTVDWQAWRPPGGCGLLSRHQDRPEWPVQSR